MILVSRRSALARAQASMVGEILAKQGFDFSLLLRDSLGDIQRSGTKADFTRDIDKAILTKEARISVHSMKDMEPSLPKGLYLGGVIGEYKKELRCDTLFSKRPMADLLGNLAQGKAFSVGTFSGRRKAQAELAFVGVEVVEIIGNIETRLKKLRESPKLDAIILAKCGIARHPQTDDLIEGLHQHDLADDFLPAAGQGMLGLCCHEDDSQTKDILASISAPQTKAVALVERALLSLLAADCSIPLGLQARQEGEKIRIIARLYGEKKLLCEVNFAIEASKSEELVKKELLSAKTSWGQLAKLIGEKK